MDRRTDDTPGRIPVDLLAELDGRLWHATRAAGYAGIFATGHIQPDAPPLYANGFCRSIGAVSLFDLACPDPPPGPTHWSHWLRCYGSEPHYWLEISRDGAANDLVSAEDTLRLWRETPPGQGGRIIGGIEAAHRGPIPLAQVVRVLRISLPEWQEM